MASDGSLFQDETERLPSRVEQAYAVAAVSVLILLIYIAAQIVLCGVLAPQQQSLKLVVEPYLLLLGLILHIQWKRVARTFREEDCARPLWMAGADCVSFVTTFWASFILLQAFLREAKII